MPETHEGQPVNVVDRVTDVHYIIEACVLCGETHRHGAVDDLEPGKYGHRAAHCDERGGYFLTVDEDTEWETA